MRRDAATLALAGGLAISAGPGSASTLAPDPVLPGGPVFEIEEIANALPADPGNNVAAPVVIDGAVHVVDQLGRILRQSGSGFAEVLGPSAGALPAGLSLTSSRAVLNVADGPGNRVFVAFTSDTLPAGLTASPLPDTPTFDTVQPAYQIIYRFEQQSGGALTAPVPLTAFEYRPGFHEGGGMLELPGTGDVLFATGDNNQFDADGDVHPQDETSHLGKIFIIDGETGEVSLAAKGVRNVQRLTLVDDGQRVAFADIGAQTAEEINSIALARLLARLKDTAQVENFGWGRDPLGDNTSREGTFLIGQTPNNAATAAATLDPAFEWPDAQIGREGAPFIAISGPVASEAFATITALFGDLPSGKLYATRAPWGSGPAEVFAVSLVETGGAPTSLFQIAGDARPDPRFFTFADGSAGVLLERTGSLYRLTEVTAVPGPGAAVGLATALALFAGVGRRRRAA